MVTNVAMYECFIELNVIAGYGTDHEHYDLNNELNVPVFTSETNDLVWAIMIPIFKHIKPLILILLADTEENDAQNVKYHNNNFPEYSANIFVSILQQFFLTFTPIDALRIAITHKSMDCMLMVAHNKKQPSHCKPCHNIVTAHPFVKNVLEVYLFL